jgi:hypothetical protein
MIGACSICGTTDMFWGSRLPTGDQLCTFCWGWAWKLGLNAGVLKWGRGTLTMKKEPVQ